MARQIGKRADDRDLIKAGADPKVATANGTTPLMLAAASGQADAVKVLLDTAPIRTRRKRRAVRRR